jgi:hypothetical protein
VGDPVRAAQLGHLGRGRGIHPGRVKPAVRGGRRRPLCPRQVVVGHHEVFEEVAPGGDRDGGRADPAGADEEYPQHRRRVRKPLRIPQGFTLLSTESVA